MGVHVYTPSRAEFITTEGLRSYMGELNAALLACGLERTSDSGQMDVGAVTALPNTVSGYFNHIYPPLLYKWPGIGGYPDIYIRIVLTVGNAYDRNTCHVPMMQVSVGRGTNGAGQLTGADVLIAAPNNALLQDNCTYIYPGWDGVISFADDFLCVCIDPGQHSSNNNHRWGLPFFCIERQENGDFHSTCITLNSDIRYTPAPTATAIIKVASSIDGVVKTIDHPCAFIDAPALIGGEVVVQKVYRYDRVQDISEFSPLVAVPASLPLWASLDFEHGGEIRTYVGCGSDVGNRITSVVANTWVPAMRTS